MRTLTTLFSLLLFGLLGACMPAPEAPPPVAGAPALWRIVDSDSEIWLFGTVHVLPPDLAWRYRALDAAFDAADELVVETDTSDPQLGARLAAAYGLLPAGQRLSERLPPEDAARLARVAAQVGIDAATLEPLRPWLASLRLSYAFAVSRGHASASGAEEILLAQARAQAKPIAFLETPEQQTRTLADLSEADQLQLLRASLRDIESDSDALAQLDATWARGDTATLAALLRAQMRALSPAAYAAIVTRRNQAWADDIARRLEGSGRVFYAVGAAHLVGEDSVIALLRARGVAVAGPDALSPPPAGVRSGLGDWPTPRAR